MSNQTLMHIYQLLYERYGPQHWWPGQTRFEIIIGAILTQNTNWQNVEKAINNLKQNHLLNPHKLNNMPTEQLAQLIRPAGYYNLKAARLKQFLDWLFNGYEGDLDIVDGLCKNSLREQLLSIKGIGPETADSIILYAFDKPIFVVDAYTCRILGRHRLIEHNTDYQQVQDFFESCLPDNTKLFNEYHALFVRLGKEHCRKKPLCKNCPLESLPHEIEESY